MKHPRVGADALALPLVLAVAACGQSQGARDSADARVVDVTMGDNTFSPSRLQVARGETVTFRFVNNGAAVHEALIGDEATQAEHQQTMANGAAMGTGTGAGMSSQTMPTDPMGGMHHGNMATSGQDGVTVVQPGETVEMSHTFDHDGPVLIGCHQPGHWESGMKATVEVG